ncbi:MAG: S8 family serine peptidase, partial [Gaiellales bacterium]
FRHARNLVAGDANGQPDIFEHDRETHTTERVSVTDDGVEANHASTAPSVSEDGRFVAFTSFASNLVSGDTNGLPDVFVRDREAQTTEIISVATDGTQANRNTFDASISADGRFVAFYSEASNLVAGDTNRTPDPDGLFTGLDVFVRDRETDSTQRVSVSSDGAEANENSLISTAPALSADGRYVVFYSTANNLVPNDTNRDSVNAPALDIFVHDREEHTTERVSVTSEGVEGNSHSLRPTISRDGRYVAFHSVATNLVPGDTNYNPQAFVTGDDVFVHDMSTRVTERVSVASDGAQGDDDSSGAGISSDGRFIVFHSAASTLVSGDTNGAFDIFVRDQGGPIEPAARGTYPEVPNDTYFSDQWGPVKIGAPQAWQEERSTGFGIKVAVIDSGVNLHDDLRCPGKLAAGATVIDGQVQAGHIPDDVDGHGTHVAGIIGACTNNRSGTVGIAPDATIVPYRVFTEDGTTDFRDVAQAIGLATDAGAHVVNLSLGPLIGPISYVPNQFAEVDAAIKRAVSAGVVVVAAAGNDSMPLCEYPALAEDVICVGATDNRDIKAWYSTFANRQDGGAAVVAPGGNEVVLCDIHSESILSLYPKEFDGCDEGRPGYHSLNGTSMAAPHVAGLAALVYDRLGGVRTPANGSDVIDAIVATATDLGPEGHDPIFGAGLVDALAAVQAIDDPDGSVSPTESPTPTDTASPTPSESPRPDTTTLTFTEASAEAAQYSDDSLFEARLTDSSDEPIANAELTFELAGSDSARTFVAATNDEGIASATRTLEEVPGPYQLTVRYAGDDAHTGAADTTSFVVEREDTDLELTVSGQGKNRVLRARLSDRDTQSDGVEARTIEFHADGSFIGSVITDENGIALLQPPPKFRGGKLNFEARFEGDAYYIGSSARSDS